MKSTELDLVTKILADAGIICNTSIDRDLKTIRSRFESEGLSFITITLPTFAKGLERALERGRMDPSFFPAFNKLKENGSIPRLFSGMTSMIFNVGDGTLRELPSIEAIDAIRQVCLAHHKLKMECTNVRKANAARAFEACEEDLAKVRLQSWKHRGLFRDVSRFCFGGLLANIQGILCANELVPKHGPGAVVDKRRGNAKFGNRNWTRRLERAMPADNYVFCNSEAWLTGHESLTFMSKAQEPPVKVIFVPKTLKTPRVIAIEPTHMQYTQQALMRALVHGIEADPLLGGSIHFTDSSVNGSLAREGSITRQVATLDLSEASDRVHAALVSDLFGSSPILRQAVFACRSPRAELPSGKVISLKKFSSMGSALCFPVESMVFYTICLMAGIVVTGSPVTKRCIEELSSKITVFGDDLVVPSAWRYACQDMLESVGLRVNHSKSFSNGYFRESCGVDAYKGHLVTPVYVRASMPKAKHDTEEILSTVATANLFYLKGYWKTAAFMRGIIEDLLGPLPHVRDTASVLGWRSFQNKQTFQRWNGTLHRFEVRGYTVRTKQVKDPLEGYDRLLKFFLGKAQSSQDGRVPRVKQKAELVKGFSDPLTEQPTVELEKSTRRGSAYIRNRWTAP
ncbi:TPA_asm: RNA-directed RNA polymerase [ssRNA phage SRR6254353_2]|uniref:RNA-directed RNA polymerase n=1 Tax=ssRNA phage SRR6254353_2 TaxID=2786494 RepID=A0A8S5L4C6_9VIRU|nr:RNA-directed RNA polymerase [ssRNA phage SRR6254353_2]DAD52544.1 TPA_asm: RNA-directed RNA polymerase [ssRNA phage SRR6254353_2]